MIDKESLDDTGNESNMSTPLKGMFIVCIVQNNDSIIFSLNNIKVTTVPCLELHSSTYLGEEDGRQVSVSPSSRYWEKLEDGGEVGCNRILPGTSCSQNKDSISFGQVGIINLTLPNHINLS